AGSFLTRVFVVEPSWHSTRKRRQGYCDCLRPLVATLFCSCAAGGQRYIAHLETIHRTQYPWAGTLCRHSRGRCHAGRIEAALEVMMGQVQHRVVETNGMRIHIAEQGVGPLVVLCHGFPECWYSWRHQLSALAGAGFHAVAPDMRGYGQSDRLDTIDQYTLLHLVGDMVGLLDALG